jgi:hypothetical protein
MWVTILGGPDDGMQVDVDPYAKAIEVHAPDGTRYQVPIKTRWQQGPVAPWHERKVVGDGRA